MIESDHFSASQKVQEAVSEILIAAEANDLRVTNIAITVARTRPRPKNEITMWGVPFEVLEEDA